MRPVFLLILASVALSAIAQAALKAGMASPGVQRALHGSDGALAVALAIGFSPSVIAGLLLYFGSALLWLFVLAKVELSYAYPFVALGFVLTAILGRLLFNDSFSTGKIIGTTLIIAGVAVLSRG